MTLYGEILTLFKALLFCFSSFIIVCTRKRTIIKCKHLMQELPCMGGELDDSSRP